MRYFSRPWHIIIVPRGTFRGLLPPIILISTLMGCRTAAFVESRPDILTAEQYAALKSEVLESQRGSAPETNTPASDRLAPTITVDEPSTAAPLSSPFRVRIHFSPASDASVIPQSFRIRYRTRFHDFDITDRAKAYMMVSQEGATAEQIPLNKPGKHTLLVEITDSKQRTGRNAFTFELQ